MKNILLETRIKNILKNITFVFALIFFPVMSVQAYSSYTPDYSSSPSYSYSSYTPSYSSGSNYNYSSYTPSYSNYDYNYSSYTPSYNYGYNDYNYSSYTPSYSNYDYNCSDCYSYGGYSDYGSYGYNDYYDYTPSYGGCSGSNCGGSTPSSGGALSALGFNLNYSDNDTTIIDNSKTDNSVRINIRNSSTTNTTNNHCSNNTGDNNCNNTTTIITSNDQDKDYDLDVICRVSKTRIREGDTVTYEVEIRGGKPSYRIEWSGDISGDDEEERVRYNRRGSYRVSVEVRDSKGNRASDECSIVVVDREDEDDDDDDRRVTVTTNTGLGTPTGNLASLESVFLSQVPYTGPGDVAKVLGVVALIAIWSTAIAMYLKKQRAVKSVSNKIADFKEQNKNANKIA